MDGARQAAIKQALALKDAPPSFCEAQAQRRRVDELVQADFRRISPLPHLDPTDHHPYRCRDEKQDDRAGRGAQRQVLQPRQRVDAHQRDERVNAAVSRDLLTRTKVQRIDRTVEAAIAAGATACPRRADVRRSARDGAFYRPTPLEVSDKRMEIIQKEPLVR